MYINIFILLYYAGDFLTDKRLYEEINININGVTYDRHIKKIRIHITRNICSNVNNHVYSNTTSPVFRYNVIFMVLTYVLPIGSMTFTYARIGLELWGSQSIGENTAGQLEGIRSKRRVCKSRGNEIISFIMLCVSLKKKTGKESDDNR